MGSAFSVAPVEGHPLVSTGDEHTVPLRRFEQRNPGFCWSLKRIYWHDRFGIFDGVHTDLTSS